MGVVTKCRMAGLAVLGVVTMVFGPAAWAAGTAGELLVECRKPTHVEDAEELARTGKATGLCRGYLGRIYAMLASGGAQGMASRYEICLPDPKPGDDELVDVYKEYAEAHPGRMEDRKLPVVLSAFRHRWPCEETVPAGAPPRTPPAPDVSAVEPRLAPPATAEPTVALDWSVATVQRRLQALGYDPGPADGVYGPLTAAAVRAFQQDHGLTPDGKLSEGLYRAIHGATKD